MNNRIQNHPVLGKLPNQKRITFQFDEQTYEGFEDDTIASALLANGIRTLRGQEESGSARGIYCNIGHCYECRVTVNGESNVRACLTPIQKNMKVESGKVKPTPLSPDNEVLPRTYEEYERMEGQKKHD